MSEQTEAPKLNIYQKIVEIRKTIDSFTRDTESFGFSYVSGSQVLRKIKDKMDELQVVLEPQVLNQQHELFNYTNKKNQEKTDFVVTGDMTYTWVNAENPSDRILCQWQYMGQQEDISKAFGSGLTYSERYFLLKYFGLPTDSDDPDGKDTSGKTGNPSNNKPSNNGSSKPVGGTDLATENQLNFVNKLLKEKTTKERTYTFLYEKLKENLGTQLEMEAWSKSLASKAIELLQALKSA